MFGLASHVLDSQRVVFRAGNRFNFLSLKDSTYLIWMFDALMARTGGEESGST